MIERDNSKKTSFCGAGMIAPHMLRWLYVDFNSYFASVEQQLNPALRGRPIAVVPVESDSTCAIAASYEAKAFGIKTGTPIYEARKMCPDLICVLGKHEKYVRTHEAILREIERHIPVTQICSIDEVACFLMANERSPEHVARLAQRIKQGLAQNIGEYIKCSIGAAPNKYLAKVATDMQKPDGLVILQPHDIPERLRILQPTDIAGIGHNMVRRLARSRIYTMDHLLALSPKHMRAIWRSVQGERLWYLLRGYDLPEQTTQRRSLGHSHVLAPELRPPEQARWVARRLLTKACARLRRMDYCATGMVLSLKSVQPARLAVEYRVAATQDSFALLELLEHGWAGLMARLGYAPIKKISVTLFGLQPVMQQSEQPDLFANPPAKKETPQQQPSRRKNAPDILCAAMDRLNQKYGRNTVLIGQTEAQGQSFTGTKIAFTRIPDIEEFHE